MIIPTQSRIAVAVSGETLQRLRARIRVPINQIISYVEIIREDVPAENASDLSTCMAETVATCESLLEATSSSHGSTEGENGSSLEQIAERCERIMQLSNDLGHMVTTGKLHRLSANAAKLHSAAATLWDVVNEFTSGATIGSSFIPHSQSSPASSNVLSGPPSVRNKTDIRAGLILVVDDNEGNRDLLSRRLTRHGHRVVLAETGRQALTLSQQHDFDLVLLDIMMPEMDGFTVLAELKTDPRTRYVPVIMISAMDEIESVVRCIELGADDYLTKPFNPTVLRARIGALLERKYLRDAELRKTHELQEALAEVEKQRRKSDALLLNILPQSVAQELQTSGAVKPMYFEDVTIVFADFAGFTVSTEQLPADVLVNVLHEYFTRFDNITRRYELEKLKTIGDCYMFAGGLPTRSPSHPVDAVLAAFEMIEATREMAAKGPVNWQLRIGIHTGPVVAGIVGIHKFAFDIWGDTVNMGQRMEANGAAGRINLSLNTYSRVKDFFSCERRGKVSTKEGREIEMYFADGLSSRPQVDGNTDRIESFQQRYQAYFRKNIQTFPDFLGIEVKR